MAYKVEVSRTADAEADQAYEWIAKSAPVAARRWYQGLLQAIRSLANNPARCPLAPEDEYFPEEIRNLLYGKRKSIFRVLFTIRRDTVYVLHVRRGAREVLRGESEEGTG
jgi:plasmid stabilization system protein ParE